MESSVIARSSHPESEQPKSEQPALKQPAFEQLSAIDVCIESQMEAGSQSLPSAKVGLKQEFRIFLSTFITIFLAELGDKTQLTTLLISAESHSPWIVFLGAGSALVATSLLGVWLGHWLSKRVSARTLEMAAAAMLLLISALLLWDVAQG